MSRTPAQSMNARKLQPPRLAETLQAMILLSTLSRGQILGLKPAAWPPPPPGGFSGQEEMLHLLLYTEEFSGAARFDRGISWKLSKSKALILERRRAAARFKRLRIILQTVPILPPALALVMDAEPLGHPLRGLYYHGLRQLSRPYDPRPRAYAAHFLAA